MAVTQAKPFLWFGCADGTLSREEVATPRTRLERELQSILSYMAQCDIEKANEPVVVLFSRLSPDVIRSGAALPSAAPSPRESRAMPDALPPPPPVGDVSAAEYWRVRSLRHAIEEARDKLNPRFLMVVSVQQPWLWTFVFFRAHEQLRPALHRLAPNAALMLADRRSQALTPSLTILDDLTPGVEVVQRLRPRIAHELRPLLLWMGEEDMEGPEERVVVLYVCADVQLLAQRYLTAGATAERIGGGGGGGGAVPGGSLADLSDAEMQRTLLARDRVHDVVESLQPRLLVLVNWLVNPDNWLMVLCRDHTRLAAGIARTLPGREVCTWAPRRTPQPVDGMLADICYSNACPRRGQVQGVQLCPWCLTSKYCSAECQAEHWKAGHCRFCSRLQAAKLTRAPPAKSGGASKPHRTSRTSVPAIKKR